MQRNLKKDEEINVGHTKDITKLYEGIKDGHAKDNINLYE